MPRALRLTLAPLLSDADGARRLFDGALVGFELMGARLSKASIGSPIGAKISLQMTFLDRARAAQDTEERALAIVSGSIVFRDAVSAVFTADATGWVPDPAADDQARAHPSSESGVAWRPGFHSMPSRARRRPRTMRPL